MVVPPMREKVLLDELEQHHLGRVRATRTELEDAGVAARPLAVTRRDLLEQLVDRELVLAERRQRLAPRVQVAALGERDQLLDLGLDGLGLRLAGLDPLVLDDLLAEVGQQRLAVRGVAAELVAVLLMAHRSCGPSWSVVAQRQTARVERLDDLVDRLLAEVRDRRELALGLRDEVADRLDAGALEAVVRADAELELLDEDVVHRALRRRGAAVDARDLAGVERAAGARPELLDAVGVGEDRQLRDQDLGGLAQRGLRVDRAVGLDVERELVVVGALADAGLLDRVGDAADGREDRVDRDDADRLVGGLVVLRRAVAAATADRHVHLELGLLLERGDVHVGVEDLDAGGQVDVLRGDLTGAGDHERRLDLGGVGVHPADDALEVQHDVGDVLGDALDRGELMGDALDPDARHGRTGERGQQHPAQRVAEGVAEAAVEGLDHERAAMLLDGFAGDARDLEVEHWRVLVLRLCRPAQRGIPPGRCAALPGEIRGGRAASRSYLEYSSTMSCSCTGVVISRRSGLRSTFAVRPSWSACSQAGTWAVSSVASRMIASAPVPTLTASTSPSRTW